MTLTDFLLVRIAEDEADAERIVYDDGGMNFRPYDRRWLAECEAKRRLLEDEHFDGRSGEHVAPFCQACSDDENLVDLPCPTLRILATVYADHPDYRERWKP